MSPPGPQCPQLLGQTIGSAGSLGSRYVSQEIAGPDVLMGGGSRLPKGGHWSEIAQVPPVLGDAVWTGFRDAEV